MSNIRELKVPDGELWLYLGKRGSGKTTLLRRTLPLNPSTQTLYIDILGLNKGGVEGAANLAPYVDDWGNHDPISVRPFDLTEDVERIFAGVRELAEDGKGTLILIDEWDAIASPHKIEPNQSWVIRYGRNFGISMAGCFRRPAEGSRLITSQSARIFSYKITEPRDIAYLGAFGMPGVDKLRDIEKNPNGTAKRLGECMEYPSGEIHEVPLPGALDNPQRMSVSL